MPDGLAISALPVRQPCP